MRVFVRSLLRLDVGSAAAAMGTAVRLAFVPSAGASGALRARSIALVLTFVFIVGLAGPLAGTGLLGMLGQDGQSTQPVVGAPTELPAFASPSPTPSPSPALKSVEKPTPKPTPKRTPRPTATKKAGTDKAVQTTKRTAKPRSERDETDERDEKDEKDEKDERDDD
jgi:outer membrane biosynthesis protein TonB